MAFQSLVHSLVLHSQRNIFCRINRPLPLLIIEYGRLISIAMCIMLLYEYISIYEYILFRINPSRYVSQAAKKSASFFHSRFINKRSIQNLYIMPEF